jgi:GDPmannose 4,6-dehydratase
MPKRALITGITGQDGGHLAELLHKKDYEVYGLIRGQQNPKKILVEREQPYVKLIEGDLTDPSSLLRAMNTAKPDEVYNLAAISHVGYSFKTPQLVADITGKGVLNMLEAIREFGGEKTVRFYQASTSEMFGGLDSTRAAHTAWLSSTATGLPKITVKATVFMRVAVFCLTTRANAEALNL